MTTQTEVLKMALECAERCESLDGMYTWVDTIAAIKKALEQLEQEPQPPYKFERYVSGSLRAQGVMVERATKLADAMRIAAKICPPANPPSAPTVLVYTTPPPVPEAHKLKPLTDEQRKGITAMWNREHRNYTVADIIDAVEAAHDIHPTGFKE